MLCWCRTPPPPLVVHWFAVFCSTACVILRKAPLSVRLLQYTVRYATLRAGLVTIVNNSWHMCPALATPWISNHANSLRIHSRGLNSIRGISSTGAVQCPWVGVTGMVLYIHCTTSLERLFPHNIPWFNKKNWWASLISKVSHWCLAEPNPTSY